MHEFQQNVVKIMIAGIGLTALYDVLVIGKKGQPGSSALALVQSFWKGYGGLLARGSGQKPPAGY
jgi:hypothetical protein